MRSAALIPWVLAACGPTAPAPGPVHTVLEPVTPEPAADAGGPEPAPAAAALRDEEPVPLDAALTQCDTNAECTYVALGCCHVTPVARSQIAAGRNALDASGARYCPVKAACGPTANGTYDGAPGTCRAHVCR